MDAAETVGAGEAGTPLERIHLKLASTVESVSAVETAAEAMAARAGFDEDEAGNIAMCVREAVINAAKHGNGFDAAKAVTATLERSAATLTFRIADEGGGFDPAALPDPLDPANLLRDSGRGVFLMRAIMDAVNFGQRNPGTEVTLIKHRHTEAGT